MSKKLYNTLRNIERQIKEDYIVKYITQKDFEAGTLLINQPGHYVLKENIIFSPNADNDYMPKPDQVYNKMPGFVLGFFAAIAIYTENVYLDLNGKTILASDEFILQQRFFSIIELANSPFIHGQGPGAFSTETSFQSSKNVIIRNGILSRNSHHCIHGNLVNNLLLENIICQDFEFVGIALNGSSNLVLHRIEIKNNRRDIAVLATYSAARFSRMFAKRLVAMPNLNLEQKTNLLYYISKLEDDLNKTFTEIKKTGKTTTYFNNPTGIADGTVYGLIIKNKGVAINELESSPKESEMTENVFLRKVNVENLKCNVPEILALSNLGEKAELIGKGGQLDASGSVFQIYNVTKNGKYSGNSLSELQLYLAELSLVLKIPLGKNNITQDVINWAKSGEDIQSLLAKGYIYKRSSDSMLHVNKGVFAYRFDAIKNLLLNKCNFKKIKNVGNLGITDTDFPGCKPHDLCIRLEYPGANSYGISIASCKDVYIQKFKGEGLLSKNGNATGLETFFNCENVNLDLTDFRKFRAGFLKNGKWKAVNFFNNVVAIVNIQPIAIGMKLKTTSISELKNIDISDLCSCAQPIKILKF